MLLTRLCTAALLALLASPVSAQIYPNGGYPDFARPGYGYAPAAAPAPRADLGGGFVEYMVTGREPRRRVNSNNVDPNAYGLPRSAYQRAWREQDTRREQDSPRAQDRAAAGWQPRSGYAYPADAGSGRRVVAVPRNGYEAAAYAPGGQTYAPEPQAVDGHQRREVVSYMTDAAPGSIVIDTGERYLYLVMEGGKAMRYGVGVGKEGFEWSGTEKISRKREWPDWRPPEEMLARRPDLPRYMPGGPDNPLGARAMYLGDTLYRIHGSNEPDTIGRAVSSGCIRMRNEDVMDLYERVPVGTSVRVI
jgi:lipoprotein-anchoring transpeptidase ErfK/SrfK